MITVSLPNRILAEKKKWFHLNWKLFAEQLRSTSVFDEVKTSNGENQTRNLEEITPEAITHATGGKICTGVLNTYTIAAIQSTSPLSYTFQHSAGVLERVFLGFFLSRLRSTMRTRWRGKLAVIYTWAIVKVNRVLPLTAEESGEFAQGFDCFARYRNVAGPVTVSAHRSNCDSKRMPPLLSLDLIVTTAAIISRKRYSNGLCSLYVVSF